MSGDPIEEQGGLNFYEYGRNDPFNTVDLFGLDAGAAGMDAHAFSINRIRENIVKESKKQVGSTGWMYNKPKGNFGKNTHKCNLFVADVAAAAGASVPFNRGWRNKYPPTAGDWADGKIPGWITVTSPEPGDVIAEAHNYSDDTGHTGIVTGEGLTTSANSTVGGTITENNWGFRPDNHPKFKRFVGE